MNKTTKKALWLGPIGILASAIVFVGCVAPAGAGQTTVSVPTVTTPAASTEQTFDQWGHIGHVSPEQTFDQWGHLINKTPEQTVDQWGHIGHKTPELVMDQWGHISER